MLTDEAIVMSPLEDPAPSTNFPFTMAVPQSAPAPAVSPSTTPLPAHHCAPAVPPLPVDLTHSAPVSWSAPERGTAPYLLLPLNCAACAPTLPATYVIAVGVP